MVPFTARERCREAWTGGVGEGAMSRILRDAIRHALTNGETQVGFQGKVWPGVINLGPISV